MTFVKAFREKTVEKLLHGGQFYAQKSGQEFLGTLRPRNSQ